MQLFDRTLGQWLEHWAEETPDKEIEGIGEVHQSSPMGKGKQADTGHNQPGYQIPSQQRMQTQMQTQQIQQKGMLNQHDETHQQGCNNH